MKDCKWSIEFVCNCEQKGALCGQRECPVFKLFTHPNFLAFFRNLNVENYSLRFYGE